MPNLNTLLQTQKSSPIHHFHPPKITRRINPLTQNRILEKTTMQTKHARTEQHTLTRYEKVLTSLCKLIIYEVAALQPVD
jgi:hypothetical protein